MGFKKYLGGDMLRNKNGLPMAAFAIRLSTLANGVLVF